jgi:hypothetical protein
MSRERRRNDRKKQVRSAPPNRRTPRRVQTERGLPVVPLTLAGGIIVVVAVLGYLILQSNNGGGGGAQTSAEKAAADDSPDLPGTYVPDQGRGHFEDSLIGHVTFPFCEGVPQSELAIARSGVPYGETPGATRTGTPVTPTATPTPRESPTPHGASVTPVPLDCHNSNPPSSGQHLGVQRAVDIGGGKIINIPPDPDVYPHDVEVPRDSIAHILEHAGVFVGWNCAEGDQACLDVVTQIEDLVNSRIDNNDNRVVMSIDLDLPVGTIGAAAWTRVLNMKYEEYDESLLKDFIATHSCRFDPENICS